MAHIIKDSELVETVAYELEFFYKEDNSVCAGFDCDENGNLINTENRAQAWHDNYNSCKADPKKYSKVVKFVYRYRAPAILQCDCGCQLELENGWANECDCGTEYNGSGQRLAHRSQWGAETGERF